ncbi:MAG: energy-coupling factor ABC transporter permease [Phycisphaerae bacterium]|nr:energy-coupling factor ABC transporter permease [Phycisphaerae bacterium]
MHMPNELLSVPVAAGCFAVSAVGVGVVCKAAEKNISQEKIPLMGILGAFIFAAQMVNFPLPFPPGASGHLTGAVFLAIVLGPYAGVVVMTSVVIVQCLIFQDGGLLALGGNIINLAIVPTFVGYAVYRFIAPKPGEKARLYIAGMVASAIAMVAAAAMLSIEAGLSGVLAVPFAHFIAAICGIHLVIGIIEGVITAALLIYLRNARPGVIDGYEHSDTGSKKLFFATVIAAVLITATCLSLLASEKPDGLEYTIAKDDGTSIIENDTAAIASADSLHNRLAPMPDYSRPVSGDTDKASAGWTSFAAVIGSVITMLAVWACSRLIRRKESCKCTTQ